MSKGGGGGWEGREDLLNCTVLRAATSQPRDCMAKTAILLPTFLVVGYGVSGDVQAPEPLNRAGERRENNSPGDDLRSSLARGISQMKSRMRNCLHG